MIKKTNAEKQFTKVQSSSKGAVTQFQSTMVTLETDNVRLTNLFESVGEEIERLTEVQRAATGQIQKNHTVIQGLKNILGE